MSSYTCVQRGQARCTHEHIRRLQVERTSNAVTSFLPSSGPPRTTTPKPCKILTRATWSAPKRSSWCILAVVSNCINTE